MLLGPEGSAVGLVSWCLGAGCAAGVVVGLVRRGLLFEFCIVDASIFVAVFVVLCCGKL